MHGITNLEIVIRIAFAILCGGVVGWEREQREKAAGLRTHIFVSMGSALIMIVSAYGFADAIKPGSIVLDPSRIAAQVVSGISFLGAGVIWFNKSKVRGLDTAAGIWTTSAMGLAAGAGMYLPAFAVTAVVLLMNIFLQPLEQRLFPRKKYGRLIIGSIPSSPIDLANVQSLMEQSGLKIKSVQLASGTEGGTVGLELNGPKNLDSLALVERLRTINGVTTVSFNEPELDND